jgi:hypothetical protein
MRWNRKTRCLLVAVIAFVDCTALSLGPFASTAEAVVGRPLTPVSYAGVARRTSRRAAYGGYGAGYPGVW